MRNVDGTFVSLFIQDAINGHILLRRRDGLPPKARKAIELLLYDEGGCAGGHVVLLDASGALVRMRQSHKVVCACARRIGATRAAGWNGW